jgi:hypothetical protein
MKQYQPSKMMVGINHADQQRMTRDGYGHQECHNTFLVFPFLGNYFPHNFITKKKIWWDVLVSKIRLFTMIYFIVDFVKALSHSISHHILDQPIGISNCEAHICKKKPFFKNLL